jgi:hypothetical protein
MKPKNYDNIIEELENAMKLKYAPFEIRNKQEESLNNTMMTFKQFLNVYPLLKEMEQEKSKEREDWKIT